MNANTFSVVYVTASDRSEALKIGRALVEERLAACINVVPGMTSVYHWQDKIEQADEAILYVKTRTDYVEAVISRVRELHSYSCPCAVAWPLKAGDPDYLRWLSEETEPH